MSDVKTDETVTWWHSGQWKDKAKPVQVVRESAECIWVVSEFWGRDFRRLKGSGYFRTEAEAWRDIAESAENQIKSLQTQLAQQNTIKNRALAAIKRLGDA